MSPIYYQVYESVFLYLLAKNNTAARQSEAKKLRQTIATSEWRIKMIDKAIEELFEANISGKVSDERLEKAVRKVFDLRPSAIIRDLDLRKPIYRQLAAYGHMGREDLGVTWEKTDRVEAIRAALED